MLGSSVVDTVSTTQPTTAARPFQVVGQPVGGHILFHTAFDTLEAARQEALSRNAATGGLFKVVLWGTDRPAFWLPPERLGIRRDNSLPGAILHSAALPGYPEALPVYAVYRRRSELLYTPTGEALPASSTAFAVAANPTAPALGQVLGWDAALAEAKGLSRRRGGRVYLLAPHRRLGRVPVASVDPRGPRGVPVAVPVTPSEYAAIR